MDIEFILIDNGNFKLYDLIHKDKVLKRLIFEKNINIKIIELNQEIDIKNAINIGIGNSTHYLIKNFNDIDKNNTLINQLKYVDVDVDVDVINNLNYIHAIYNI